MKKLIYILTVAFVISMVATATRAQEPLTQTFIGGDASFPYSFKYPADWMTPQKGGITTTITNKNKSINGSFFYPNSSPGTAKEALAAYTVNYKQPLDIQELKLEDRDAARVESTIGNRTQIILMIDFTGNGQKGTVIWEGSKANLTKAEDTLLAMAASFHVPPDAAAVVAAPTSTSTAIATKPATPAALTGIPSASMAIIVGQVGGSTGMGNEMYILGTDGKNGKSLQKFGTTSSAQFTIAAWSPDGGHLAYYAIKPPGPGLVIVDAEGGNPQVLMFSSFVFAWSPDGTAITNAQKDGDDWTMINIGLTGTGTDIKALFTVKNMQYIDYIRWSPDGKWLAYVGTPIGNSNYDEEVHIIDATGSNDQVIVPAGKLERNVMWSPDDKQIAYIGDSGAAGKGLTTVDIASKAKKVIAAQAIAADWSPDGSQFAYADRNGKLFIVNADGKKPTPIKRPADLKGQVVAVALRPAAN